MVVISGKDRGAKGTVTHAMPKENRVVVSGVNVVKRHRKNRAGGTGQIVEKPMPIHVSNVRKDAGEEKAKHAKK